MKREYTWKTIDVQPIDISDKVIDHLSSVGKSFPKYEFESEYMV
jgi:hypothetical protein